MDEVVQVKHHSKRRNKKLLLLFIVFGMSSLMLVFTTYAWFVGVGTVKVNSFVVNLSTENSMEISLDGYTWTDNVSITQTSIKAHSAGGSAYNANTNKWVGADGLVPVSSSGDNTNGKLDIFSKSSLVQTNGGYKLVSTQIQNGTTESDHYVTFDIFVKNKSGDVYTPTYNMSDDEAIYLAKSSKVTGTPSGSTSYGVQNSVRVAFVQIGRINIADLVTGETPNIKCETPISGDKFLPLCNNTDNHYRVMIWEPNELAHDSKLVSYYNMVCKKKTAATTYTTDSCKSITSGYVPAYTVKKAITSSLNVDVYEGHNYFTSTIQEQTASGALPLQNTKTLTDAMKDTEGQYTLMKLAPHSVTKIRVYVYLEGQDVDNYDLVSNDQDIKVEFSLTKQKTFVGEIVADDYFERG